MARYTLLLILIMLTGCATYVPKEISSAVVSNAMVSEVQGNVDRYKNTRVRWGGSISQVENKTNFTWVEIVSRRLNDKGKPSSDDDWSGGRFIAQFDGFVDPTIYTSGKLITVVGPITGFTTREIGAFTYQYPIVEVDTSYLWPPAPDPIYYPPPYWYYDPWYPYYYPYHRYPPYWY